MTPFISRARRFAVVTLSCAAAVLIAACTSGREREVTPTRSSTNPSAGPTTAEAVCAARFPDATAFATTTIGGAFRYGTSSPQPVSGYSPDTSATECVVPSGRGDYAVWVIMPNGVAVSAGTQGSASIVPRP